MDYWKKIDQNIYADLAWNIPETKQGTAYIIGGNSQNFNPEIRIAELLKKNFPIQQITNILPDELKNKLPNLENFLFLPSTDSGSFSNSEQFEQILNHADINLIFGDLSKNSITENALNSACRNAKKPTLLTRDSIDLLASKSTEQVLMNDNLIIFGSMVQIQKLLHSVYYPKVITLSQPLMQIVETLHKFTLSYPSKIITLHNGQIIIAENGNLASIPLEQTKYSQITIWSGELATKILTYNLFNPNNFYKSTIAAIF